MKILLLDNYDSFTYNLAYLIRGHCDLDVVRNDKIGVTQCTDYDGIILSPGPGIPRDAGIMMSLIKSFAGSVPMLGICLGHQAIAEHCDSTLINLKTVQHGTQNTIEITDSDSHIFKDLPSQIKVGRYHSWAVKKSEIKNLNITASAKDGCIMAIENKNQKLYGVQFHPESILTPKGDKMMHNFLDIVQTYKK